MNSEYLKLVEKAQKKRIKLTNSQTEEIKNLYKDIAKDLQERIKKSNKRSLTERWLCDYKKQFRKDIKKLNKVLKKNIKESMLKSANIASFIQIDFFNMLDKKFNIKVMDMFSGLFTRIPQEVLFEIISGDFYKDGKGLSTRIWNNEIRANKSIDYIIKQGLLEKKDVYSISKDLEKFINPNIKTDWDFKKIYPGVGNKKIEYNSFRLAVTSISHAYQLSMQRSCEANIFVDGIQWNISNSHRGTCSLCAARDKKIYKTNELPLDHPLGVCYFTPVIQKSLDDIGTELHDWVHGKNNKKLDNWYKKYGINYLQML